MISINNLAIVSPEIPKTTEKLAAPAHALTILNSGIGMYQLEGQPTVYVPMIRDQKHPKVFFENIDNEVLTLKQKERIIAGLLATELSITSVINQVLNSVDSGISIPKLSEITKFTPIKPKFGIAIVGRSKMGKTTVTRNLQNMGWLTLNLDARERLENGETDVHNKTETSTYAIAEQMHKVTIAELQSNRPVIIDTGGFTHKSEKFRPDEPLSAIARGQEIILIVDQARADQNPSDNPALMDTIDTAVLNNPAFKEYVYREYFSHSLYGNPDDVAKTLSEYLEAHIDMFTRHAQKLRIQFALHMALSIEDKEENDAIINKLMTLFEQATLYM